MKTQQPLPKRTHPNIHRRTHQRLQLISRNRFTHFLWVTIGQNQPNFALNMRNCANKSGFSGRWGMDLE
ncbi:hypothetical protein HanIR_Chr08g0352351 [Helianthus annuus]|nr:hypothetical protein HanIR_Chr08g0352351 [Helianthus annuus]